MRIMQLIDSLEAGGAERMAVNYANALVDRTNFSGLVVSRKEGFLTELLDPKVNYLFVNKQSSIDVKALWKLRNYVVKNKVDVVQAHSTSFFMAFLLKMICPSIKIIWHDHYGDSDFLIERKTFIFKLTIPFFSGIIAVNQHLKKWAEVKLHFSNTIYLPNFPAKERESKVVTVLKGNSKKRIICLANLRVQKNHFLLIEVAIRIQKSHPDWSFHLVGKDFEDEYSAEIKSKIKECNLQENVFLYGSQNAVPQIMAQASIGILTSQSEGLPVALLEYGWAKLPVVSTKVGEIASIITHNKNGLIVLVDEVELFYNHLVDLIESESLRDKFGEALCKTIQQNYSEESTMKQYLHWLQKTLK